MSGSVADTSAIFYALHPQGAPTGGGAQLPTMSWSVADTAISDASRRGHLQGVVLSCLP